MKREVSEEERGIALIGSVTQAMLAQRALLGEGLRAEVIKADAVSERYGCAYAIEYPYAAEARVRQILRSREIHFRILRRKG